MTLRGWIGSFGLLLAVVAIAGGLAAWKYDAIQEANAVSANQPEPMESVTAAVVKQYEYRPATTSIGTILALQSISLRNELAGTVERVALTPGEIVEPGTVLVALDVSVEEAELDAQEAQAALARTLLKRVQEAHKNRAISAIEVDRAQAEYDVAIAEIARIKAVIDRKTIVAPFRARLGISDVHEGQYLEAGTLLTTLQGVNESVNVNFTVAQQVAANLRVGDRVDVQTSGDRGLRGAETPHLDAEITAIDARVDPTTRNALVRARITSAPEAPAPGASVRVRVPVGPQRAAVLVPVSAVRKGPGGDRVFVLAADDSGAQRAQSRLVQTGPMFGDEVVIESGLNAGEIVAASGSFKLRDGVLVAVADQADTVARTTK